MDTMKDTKMQPATDAVIEELRNRLEAAEKDVAIKEEVIDSLAAVVKRLDAQCDAAEKERDDVAQQLVQSERGKRAISEECDALRNEIAYVKEVEFPRKAQAVADAWKGKCKRLEVERDALRAKTTEMERQAEMTHNEYPTRLDICDGKYTLIIDMDTGRAECLRYGEKWRDLVGDKMVLALFDELVEARARAEAAKAETEDLRAKIAKVDRQEPLDAGSDVFRGAFEAALKAGNWPATRQGDGYRSPSTQIAWRIAFSTVNRLKLYLAPGAKGEEK